MSLSEGQHHAPPWLRQALEPFLGARSRRTEVLNWRFQSRYFSSIVDFTLADGEEPPQRFLAKFPKAQRARGFTRLPHRSPQDLSLARREYEAYSQLQRAWPSNRTRFVNPVFFHEASGMLVFPYIKGEDLWSRTLVRKLVFRLKISDRVLSLVRGLGEDLAGYHLATAAGGSFDLAASETKLAALASGVGLTLRNSCASGASSGKLECVLVPGIKGFEVRSARATVDALWLFDPGHLKAEPPEADLARFIVSVRMAPWGTPYFVIPVHANAIEEALLRGYSSIRAPHLPLLDYLIKREVLKNWRSGIEVTRMKGFPKALLSLFETGYVHAGFRRIWCRAVASR
jgi:hypothetical protein